MKEKEFDELLEDEETSISINKKIKRIMNKKIYSKIIISFLAVCLMIGTLYYGCSWVFNTLYYNPYHEDQFLNQEKNKEFAVLMTDYIQMYYPGMMCILDGYDEDNIYHALGFGKYEVKMKLQRIFDPLYLDGQSNITFRINKSKMTCEISGEQKLTHIIGEFKGKDDSDFQELYSLKSIYNEIKKLPDSVHLDVSVSFNNELSLEQVVKLIRKYPKASFVWLALKNQEISSVHGITGGMPLYDATIYDFSKDNETRYSGYYLPYIKDLSASDLKKSYLSKLKLLIDHPEFLKIMQTAFPDSSHINEINENYKKATKSMNVYGVRVYIDKEDLLSMIDNENVSYLMIQDIKLSVYQR